jgi:hypothetical protein
MGSFKRSFLGYRRAEVDAAISSREGRIGALEREVADAIVQMEQMAAKAAVELKRNAMSAAARMEREVTALSQMVLEREREISSLTERLGEANERHDRSIASLENVSARVEEIHAQARGQATRIRMKALHEAVEVSRRVQELSDGEAIPTFSVEAPSTNGNGNDSNGHEAEMPPGLFEGLVKVEIGPLGDFSQLVGFEDAAGQIDATSEISVERFSEGRATLSMRLNEPVELLRELEERSTLEFRVRHTADDNLILDIDEDQGPEQQVA